MTSSIRGIDGKSGVTESELGKETVTNDALYDEDSFHPNNTGYEIMKEAVLEKIHATEKNGSSEKKVKPATTGPQF